MSGRFPFAAFADRLADNRRDVFAAFAGAMHEDVVWAHVRSQDGHEVPRAAPLLNWRKL